MENSKNINSNPVYFVDKFILPNESVAEFKEQLNYNRRLLSSFPGLIRFDAMERLDQEKNLTIITIALWENEDYINKAKSAMQAEFKRNQFIPAEFYKRLNVKVERNQFTGLN